MQQQSSICDFNSSDSWVILSPIELSIKRKIEAVGTPLKDWDIQINYGIKTGFNDAFIITTEKRNEILENCKDADERKRTDELIRPILRGRDIKRYGYDWAGLWLINIHNGVRGRIPRIRIEDYPAIKTHLDQYWDKISTRADQGDTPYNLRNCAYLDDFSKPKIIYQELTQGSSFALDNDGTFFGSNTTYILTGTNLKYLLCFLNSKCIEYAYRKFYGSQLGGNGLRWLHQYVVNIPIPLPTGNQLGQFSKMLQSQINNAKMDELVFDLYNLTEEERNVVNDSL